MESHGAVLIGEAPHRRWNTLTQSADYFSRIARETSFDAVNLEKVYRLKEVLGELARHPFLKDRLVLKGGTAINLFLFDLPRLSLDIDLNYIGQLERGAMEAERPLVQRAIQEVCAGLGYGVRLGVEAHALVELHLEFPDHMGRANRIQIEVNYLMRACALRPRTLPAMRFPGERESKFAVLANEELIAGKLKAFIERTHPRDLYDLYRFSRSGVKYDAVLLGKLAVLFASTLDLDLREYTAERYMRLDQADIERLLHPLLRANDQPTRNEMFAAAMPLLAAPLQHEKEKAYLDALAAGRYQSELLFPDHPEIAARVARHPALLWKAQNVAGHLTRRRSPSAG